MNIEEITKVKLIDQLRQLKAVCESAVRIVTTKQYLKSNRINSLLKKRNEISCEYRRTLKYIDEEISATRGSNNFRTVRSGSSIKQN